MEIEQLAVERPEALARVPVDPLVGIDEAKAPRSSPPPASTVTSPTEVARSCRSSGRSYESEDATLVEVNPLVKTRRRPDRRPRRQGLARRERRLPAPGARGARRHLRGGPAGGGGQGEGPQLRQAGRLGRHHRQRRRPGDEHARRRRVRRARSSRRSPKPANFLDIGGGASAEVMANGLEIILGDAAGQERVRQRLRRHHRLRRGRQRDRAGASSCWRAGRAVDQAAGRPARRQQRRAGPADPTDAALPGLEQVDTMDGAARRAAELAADAEEGRTDGDLPERRLAGHRPGHDRLRGPQAHPADARLRHHRSSAASPPARAARPSSSTPTSVPVFDSVAEAVEATGAERHRDLRAGQVHQGRGGRGDRGRDPAGRGDHRGRPGQGHRRVLRAVARVARPG